ncbi:MAG TPA: serine hydrolase domain-containing protein [Burkholderiaceae bacterium]
MRRRGFAAWAALVAAAALAACGTSAAMDPGGAAAPAPGASASAPDAAHALDAADLSAWLDGRVPYALKTGDIAGMVISVVKDGRVLLQKGYGYADVAARRPMDPQTTLVRPGSTSKLFTWTAVMQLVQQGRLDLDRDVDDYLDFKVPEPYGKPVTMRDLMNHRGGFEEGLKDVLSYDPARAQSTERYLKTHPRAMLFPPGTVPAYSNYGVALAGYIVQRVSGEAYDAYIARHVFEPLGMAHSTMAQPVPAPLRPSLAEGYRTASGPPSPFEFVVTAPAGSASTTAADMARFMLAHLQQGRLDGHAILDPKTTALMHAPTESALPGFATMAHGFFRSVQNGRTVIGHGGDTIVFHTELDLLPQEGVGIFFTFKSRGRDNAVYAARRELFDGFMDRYFPAPSAPDPPALASARADAGRIAGRYQGSRRIEHGFLSLLYLLGQVVITANADGTIVAPDPLGLGTQTFREVAPGLWRELGGSRQLRLAEVGGVKTVVDSEDATGVLQASPFASSAPLTLGVLAFSLLTMVLSVVYWVMAALARRAGGAPVAGNPRLATPRRLQRAAIVVDALYLAAWSAFIAPVLDTDIGAYNSGNDWIVRLLQASGLLAVAAAVAGAWAAWKLLRSDASRLTRAWAVVVAFALLGVVWVAAMGGLLRWDVNY